MNTDDDDAQYIHHSSSKRESTTDWTSNPKSSETYSMFGDASCGEALFAQHVIIDFKPNEKTDTDIEQKKVCSFWQFINNVAEIQNLKVEPKKDQFPDTSSTTKVMEDADSRQEFTPEDSVVQKTAVDMLEFAEERNLIDRIFEAKLPQSKCTLGSREYKEGEVFIQSKKKKGRKRHDGAGQSNRKPSSEHLPPIGIFNRKLDEWDAQHPKSMEPPGHALTLQHCIIQRQVFPKTP